MIGCVSGCVDGAGCTHLYTSQGPMMVGANTFTTGRVVTKGPRTGTVEVGVDFQLPHTLAAVGAGVGLREIAVVVVVPVVLVVEVHAALIVPPRTVIASPMPTVDPPPRVMTTEEGESHRHPWLVGWS